MGNYQPQIYSEQLAVENTRIFDAPRHIVFKAWSDPDIIKHWWGPSGFTNTFNTFDFKPEGRWEFTMHAAKGASYPNLSIFREIHPNEKIVLDHIPKHTFRLTITFEDFEGKTKLVFHQKFDDATDFHQIKNFVAGANEQNLDRLEVQVAKLLLNDKPLVSRTFNASRELVFKTFTEAEHLAKWWGPAGFDLTVKELNLQVNGFFHYKMQSEQGYEMWGKMEYFEINEPHELVLLSSFADADGNIIDAPFPDPWPTYILNVWKFTEEEAGKTNISIFSAPFKASSIQKQTFIDGIPSMENGFGGTFDKLGKYLREIK